MAGFLKKGLDCPSQVYYSVVYSSIILQRLVYRASVLELSKANQAHVIAAEGKDK